MTHSTRNAKSRAHLLSSLSAAISILAATLLLSGSSLFASSELGWEPSLIGPYVECVAADPTGPLWVLQKWPEDPSHQVRYNVLRSLDLGDTWTTVTQELPTPELVSYTGPEGGFARTFTIASDGNLWLTLSTGPILAYRKDLEKWTTTTLSVPGHKWGINCLSDGTIFVGGTQAVYRSPDNGDSWQTLSMPQETALGIRDIDRDSSGTLWACGEWVYRSRDNGFSWQPTLRLKYPFDLNFVDMLFLPDGSILVGYSSLHDGAICRSIDQGDTWQVVLDTAIWSLIASDDGTLYAAGGWGMERGIFRSLDGGRNWRLFNNGFPDKDPIIGAAFLCRPADGPIFAYIKYSAHSPYDGIYRLVPQFTTSKNWPLYR